MLRNPECRVSVFLMSLLLVAFGPQKYFFLLGSSGVSKAMLAKHVCLAQGRAHTRSYWNRLSRHSELGFEITGAFSCLTTDFLSDFIPCVLQRGAAQPSMLCKGLSS